MGELLALSLFFTLLAAFFVVPATLGEPPAQPDRNRPEGDSAGRGPAFGQRKPETVAVK